MQSAHHLQCGEAPSITGPMRRPTKGLWLNLFSGDMTSSRGTGPIPTRHDSFRKELSAKDGVGVGATAIKWNDVGIRFEGFLTHRGKETQEFLFLRLIPGSLPRSPCDTRLGNYRIWQTNTEIPGEWEGGARIRHDATVFQFYGKRGLR